MIASDAAASSCIALPGSGDNVPAPNIRIGIASGSNNNPPSALAPLSPAVSEAIVTARPASAGSATAKPINSVTSFSSGKPIKADATIAASSGRKTIA